VTYQRAWKLILPDAYCIHIAALYPVPDEYCSRSLMLTYLQLRRYRTENKHQRTAPIGQACRLPYISTYTFYLVYYHSRQKSTVTTIRWKYNIFVSYRSRPLWFYLLLLLLIVDVSDYNIELLLWLYSTSYYCIITTYSLPFAAALFAICNNIQYGACLRVIWLHMWCIWCW